MNRDHDTMVELPMEDRARRHFLAADAIPFLNSDSTEATDCYAHSASRPVYRRDARTRSPTPDDKVVDDQQLRL